MRRWVAFVEDEELLEHGRVAVVTIGRRARA